MIWMCLSGTVVALRFFVKRASKAGLWYDDYAILVALLFAYGTPVGVLAGKETILYIPCYMDTISDNCRGVRNGFGKQMEGNAYDALVTWLQILYALVLVYIPGWY